MQGGDDVEQRLTGLVYEAVHQPSAWSKLVGGLCEVMGGHAGSISVAPIDGHTSSPIAFSNTRPLEKVAELWPKYGNVSPFVSSALEKGISPGTYLLSEAIPREEWDGWDYYEEFMRAADIEHGLHMLLGRDEGSRIPPVVVAVGRPRGTEDFGSQEKSLAVALYPHLRRVTQITALDAAAPQFDPAIGDAFDQFATPCFLIKFDGRVIHANRAAQRVCGPTEALTLTGGVLSCRHRATQRRLSDAIAHAVGFDWSWKGRSGADVIIPSEAGAPPRIAVVTPLGPDNPFLGWVSAVRAAVYVLDTGQRLETAPAAVMRFKTLFALTQTEAEIMAELIAGRSPKEIAESRKLKIATVRHHVKLIFSKTDTHRQSEMSRFRPLLDGPK